jgi:ABC-type transport system substrate-binding protein
MEREAHSSAIQKIFWTVLIVVTTALLACLIMKLRGKPVSKLTVGCPAYWGSLVPALQHTAYADALLSNQFEALVKEGEGGAILPGLARSWIINDNFTKFQFKLDTKRKFSNGKLLTAEVVKTAWEYGLSLPAQSSNSSLQDVLYLVEGFSSFRHNGNKLSGVKVISDDTLEIHFTKPFRTALSEFSTGRLSIFVLEGTHYFGTGPYIIDHVGESELNLIKNPLYEESVGFPEVTVKIVSPNKVRSAIESGEIDLYAFADRTNLESCQDSKVSCFIGMESAHSSVVPNGLNGRFFSNLHYRLALQYLIQTHLKPQDLPGNYKLNFEIDPQIYLKLQPGRLEQVEVQKLVEIGAKFVDDFIKATQHHPLYLVTSEMNNWVQRLLSSLGVKFDSRSGIVPTKDRIKMYYKTFEPDLLVMGTSISSGDPDGIFHVLAKDGAIHSPMLYRKEVSDLLDQGREILDVQKLDEHYKKVSRSVLKEVPFVHIGFIKGLFAYNPSRVRVVEGIKQREGNQFTLFEPN